VRSGEGVRVERLRRRQDFERVFRSGRQAATRLLVVRFMQGTAGRCRLGVAVSRQAGSAVRRNRTRRRVREVVRRGPALAGGWDIVVIARAASREAEWGSLCAAWRELVAHSGVLAARRG
jgi:ribonuclease P protein component